MRDGLELSMPVPAADFAGTIRGMARYAPLGLAAYGIAQRQIVPLFQPKYGYYQAPYQVNKQLYI